MLQLEDLLQWALTIVVGLFAASERFIRSTMLGRVKAVENKIEEVSKSRTDEDADLRRSLYEHKLHAAETFATRAELVRVTNSIEKKLDTLIHELKSKADKH